MLERVKRISGKVNRYLSDLVPGVPCYTTLGAPFLCISGMSLLDSPFDLISGIQSFKLAFSEQHYSIMQANIASTWPSSTLHEHTFWADIFIRSPQNTFIILF